MTVIGAKELKARLAASPGGAYLFFGEEEHLKRVYLSRFRALVTENTEFNVTTLEVTESDPISQIRAEFSRMPFLSPLRFLDVRGLSLHKLSEKESEELCALLSDCPEDLICIFYFFECDIPFASNIPRTQKKLKDLPVYRALPDNVAVVHFTHPTPAELCAYYEAKFKSRAVTVSRGVVQELCTRAAGDMVLLENETDKLISLVGHGGEVTLEMVDEALPALTESAVYKLSDAIESCDAPRALTEYAVLRKMKFEPIPLLASVCRAVANLALVKGSFSDAELEKTFGLKAFRIRALKSRAAALSLSALARCQILCSDVDRNLKNTSIDGDVLLQTLIVDICRILKESKC